MKVSEEDSANLLELIHKRRKHSSTIFCSQYREEEWYEKFGGKDNPLTDAIMDRIAFDSYKIPIESLEESVWFPLGRTTGFLVTGQAALPHRNNHLNQKRLIINLPMPISLAADTNYTA